MDSVSTHRQQKTDIRTLTSEEQILYNYITQLKRFAPSRGEWLTPSKYSKIQHKDIQ